MEGLLGKTLDNTYRIDALLGRGGMGAVYRARDTVLYRDVAIKVMHPHLTDDPDFQARFLQEARAIAALEHPGIVQVYACRQDQGLLYIVMDYIRGQTLQTWLRRFAQENKIVLLPESLTIIQQVTLALHYAHQKRVFHRDIKPANIMLKPTDPMLRQPRDLAFRPVLTDFGLAKLAAGAALTRTGTSMGTPAYMSPEQCLGLALDGRSDIYSVGIVLFELTVGRVPFQVGSLTEAIRLHTQESPPPPRSMNPSLPADVEEIILRALGKKPEDRFQTAYEMAQALGDAIAHLPADLSIAPSAVETPIPGPDESSAEQSPVAYVSLMTRLERESIFHSPPETQLWESSTQAKGTGAELFLVSPDGLNQRIPLEEQQVLTVGRGEQNEVPLVDPKVSRRHVRIEFDGQNLTVTDLNSTNGTFLGNSRLLPGVSQPWLPGTALRLGDHWISFKVQADALSSVASPPPVIQTPEGGPATHKRITAILEPEVQQVEAGQSTSFQVQVANQGPQVDHIQVSIEGISAHWVPVIPPLLRLLPGEAREIALSIQPPRSPESRAGDHALTTVIVSQRAPNETTRAGATLTIAPYYELGLEIHPQKGSGIIEGHFALQVSNRGNIDVAVALEGIDPEEGCSYHFDPPRPAVSPGETRSVQLAVRPKRPLPGASAKPYPFSVTARVAERPDLVRQIQGEWTHLPPDFDVTLRPRRQSGIDAGTFQIQVHNHSPAELSLELEATNPEEACLFTFDPTQVTVPAGQEGQSVLTLRPKTQLSQSEERAFPFTVQAFMAGARRVTQQVQGEWVQVPPDFDLALEPPRRSGATEATFQVQVSNQGPTDLPVYLSASDPGETCLYVFDQPRLSVPPGGARLAQLQVRAKNRLIGESSRRHCFTVSARPTQAPQFSQQVEGEWEQIPVVQPAPATVAKRRWLPGCVALLVGFVLTNLAVWAVSFFTNEVLQLDDASILVIGIAWLIGLGLTINWALKVWKKQVPVPPRPDRLPEE